MGVLCGGSRGRGARHKGCSHTCPNKRQKSVVVARRRAAKVEMTLAESVVRSRACAVHLVVIRFRGTPATVSLSRLAPPSSQARTTAWAGQSLSLRLYRNSPRGGGGHPVICCSVHPFTIHPGIYPFIYIHINIIPAPSPSRNRRTRPNAQPTGDGEQAVRLSTHLEYLSYLMPTYFHAAIRPKRHRLSAAPMTPPE